MYPYPYYSYHPELWRTTFLDRSFPEHHLPLEHARHQIAEGVHDLFHDTYPGPKVDVRETLKSYYIDIELPGLESKDQIHLKWINSRTLFLEADKVNRSIAEDTDVLSSTPDVSKSAAVDAAQSTGVQGTAESDKISEKPKEKKPEHTFHYLTKERDLGKLKRALNFPIPVDREGMNAKLHHGILEITLTKKDDQQPEKHDIVHIEHDGA